MKEEKIVNDRLKLIEKELSTISEAFERIEKSLASVEELKEEMKALKVCLGKLEPRFKDEFLAAMKKVTKKG